MALAQYHGYRYRYRPRYRPRYVDAVRKRLLDVFLSTAIDHLGHNAS